MLDQSGRMIFIVGMPRSGTTLLGMILNSHSKIAITPETKYFTKHWNRCGQDECLKSQQTYRRFLDSLIESDEYRDLGFDDQESMAILKQLLSSSEPTHREILGTLLWHYAKKFGKHYPGEKTPGHHAYIPLIAEYFPEACFIYLGRDPRSVSYSLQGMPWMKGNVVNHVIRWVWYERLIQGYVEDGYPVYQMKYEDLVDEPERVIRAVCEFIGLDYEAQMVSGYHLTEPIFDPEAEPWKRRSLEPIDPSRKNRWKGNLGRAEKLAIEFIAGRWMRRRGYDPVEIQLGPRALAEMLLLLITGLAYEVRNLSMNPLAKVRRLLTSGERAVR